MKIALRGGIKKTVFFYFRSKGGWGSHPKQKGFIRFFGIICHEKGGGPGQSKKILIRKYSDFLTKGGGGAPPNPKGFYQIFGQNW